MIYNIITYCAKMKIKTKLVFLISLSLKWDNIMEFFFIGKQWDGKITMLHSCLNIHTIIDSLHHRSPSQKKLSLLSMRSFFCERIVSCFLSVSTDCDWSSLSRERPTSSDWSRSHICCNSAISCCSASIDFWSELIWISRGPSSTP